MSLRNFEGEISYLDGKPILKTLQSAEGVPIPDKDGRPQFIPMTLKSAIADALTGNYEGEQNLSFDKKWERWKLAKKVMNATGDIDLDSKEITLINTIATKGLTTLVFGQVIEALEREISAHEPE